MCYYKALQIGEASKVVPVDKLSIVFTLVFAAIFLHEAFTLKTVFGGILITAGTLLIVTAGTPAVPVLPPAVPAAGTLLMVTAGTLLMVTAGTLLMVL